MLVLTMSLFLFCNIAPNSKVHLSFQLIIAKSHYCSELILSNHSYVKLFNHRVLDLAHGVLHLAPI